MKESKNCTLLNETVKFYRNGSPRLFVNNQEVGPILRNGGETLEQAQKRMVKEYVLNTPGMEKYIKLIEKRP